MQDCRIPAVKLHKCFSTRIECAYDAVNGTKTAPFNARCTAYQTSSRIASLA